MILRENADTPLVCRLKPALFESLIESFYYFNDIVVLE